MFFTLSISLLKMSVYNYFKNVHTFTSWNIAIADLEFSLIMLTSTLFQAYVCWLFLSWTNQIVFIIVFQDQIVLILCVSRYFGFYPRHLDYYFVRLDFMRYVDFFVVLFCHVVNLGKLDCNFWLAISVWWFQGLWFQGLGYDVWVYAGMCHLAFSLRLG